MENVTNCPWEFNNINWIQIYENQRITYSAAISGLVFLFTFFSSFFPLRVILQPPIRQTWKIWWELPLRRRGSANRWVTFISCLCFLLYSGWSQDIRPRRRIFILQPALGLIGPFTTNGLTRKITFWEKQVQRKALPSKLDESLKRAWDGSYYI